MSLADASFDAVVSFTMLHHILSEKLQDRLLAEAWRTLRPGGILAGTDGLDSRLFRFMNLFDTLVVVDPKTLPDRLRAARFQDVNVEVNSYAFRSRVRWRETIV
jgi:SAM-dependent methyltransferase